MNDPAAPKATRELSHVELKCIEHIHAKARDLRGLQYTQARQALRDVQERQADASERLKAALLKVQKLEPQVESR